MDFYINVFLIQTKGRIVASEDSSSSGVSTVTCCMLVVTWGWYIEDVGGMVWDENDKGPCIFLYSFHIYKDPKRSLPILRFVTLFIAFTIVQSVRW